MTKIADSDKYKYFGYVIGFDVRESFSLLNGSRFEKYVIIIFGADLSLLVHINNNKKDILILGKGPTDGSYYVDYREKNVRSVLLSNKRNFVYVCVIMERIVTYLLMRLKPINSKQKFLK